MEKVAAIFGEIQRCPTSGNKGQVQKLIKVIQTESAGDKENILNGIWRGCLDQCMVCPKKDRVVEKMITFITNFVTMSASENDDILASCVGHLLQRSKATDKNVRTHACRIISGIIQSAVDNNLDVISDSLIDSIIKDLSPRLKDKHPNVRVWAIKIFQFIQGKEPDDCIVAEITRMMSSDTSKDVRVAAVESVLITKDTLPQIIARIKDVRHEVRIAAFKRLATKDISLKALDSSSIAAIVRFGINDRDMTVKDACKALILKWLSVDGSNDVPRLLRQMDPQMYEEEAEMLGGAVMEIIEKGEGVPQDLSIAVRQYGPDWETDVLKIPPSEILWAFLRCDYARKHMTQLTAEDYVDALVPDTIKLSSMLQECLKPTLYSNTRLQMTVRHLIRMTSFLDISDVCGCKGLKEVCEVMLAETNLPEMLVEPVLNAWNLASGFSGSAEAIRAAVNLAQAVTSAASDAAASNPRAQQAQSLDTSMENIVLPGEEDDEDMDRSDEVRILSAFRSLQIVSWSLQQNIGARDTVQGAEAYAEMLPFIMECLVEPNSDLRGVSVHCLGLIALTSQEKCQEVHEIILQVARNESEENEVRCCALEALVDIATVYEERFKDDMVLTNFLVRLQECSEPALARIGAESAAKLLFSGRLSEPKLFANLVKFFFLPEISGSTDEENDDEGRPAPEEAFFGSAARLQQILSVFFQAFFVAGNGREAIAIGSTADLVADLALLVRDREIEPIAMAKIANHLLALCDNIKNPVVDDVIPTPEATEENASADNEANASSSKKDYSETARNMFRARLTASISREMLKLGSSRAEKAAAKEFVKVLTTLSPGSWIKKELAPVVMSVINTLYQCCNLEKTSQKLLVDKIAAVCVEIDPTQPTHTASEDEGHLSPGAFYFYNLAPGLGDMMHLVEKDVDDKQTKELYSLASSAAKAARSSSQGPSKKTSSRAGKRAKSGNNDEEEDDEEEDDDDDEEDGDEDQGDDENVAPVQYVNPARAGLSRSSKAAATSKILNQISEMDGKGKPEKASRRKESRKTLEEVGNAEAETDEPVYWT